MKRLFAILLAALLVCAFTLPAFAAADPEAEAPPQNLSVRLRLCDICAALRAGEFTLCDLLRAPCELWRLWCAYPA